MTGQALVFRPAPDFLNWPGAVAPAGQPHASLELAGEKIPVLAHDAEGDEYARLWQIAINRYPGYRNYQKMTGRHIPIVVFQAVC